MNADETWAQIQRQERQLCDSWRKIHLRVLMLLSAGAVVVELLLFFLWQPAGLILSRPSVYVMKYLLFPLLCNGAAIVLCLIGLRCRRLSAKACDALVSLAGVWICFILTLVHGTFTSVYMLYFFPVIMTVVYGSRRLMSVIALLSLISCLFSAFVIDWDPGKIRTVYYTSDIALALILQVSAYVAGMMILEFENKKRSIARHKDQERLTLKNELGVDSLTGVGSRRAMQQCFKQLSERQDYQFVILDIDHFKQVNDQYGHLIGDEVLKILGQVLSGVDQEAAAFRYGGDEFCLVFFHTDDAAARQVIRHVSEEFSAQVRRRFSWLSLTLSTGYSASYAQQTPLQTFQQADQALYRAKRNERKIR